MAPRPVEWHVSPVNLQKYLREKAPHFHHSLCQSRAALKGSQKSGLGLRAGCAGKSRAAKAQAKHQQVRFLSPPCLLRAVSSPAWLSRPVEPGGVKYLAATSLPSSHMSLLLPRPNPASLVGEQGQHGKRHDPQQQGAAALGEHHGSDCRSRICSRMLEKGDKKIPDLSIWCRGALRWSSVVLVTLASCPGHGGEGRQR